MIFWVLEYKKNSTESTKMPKEWSREMEEFAKTIPEAEKSCRTHMEFLFRINKNETKNYSSFVFSDNTDFDLEELWYGTC